VISQSYVSLPEGRKCVKSCALWVKQRLILRVLSILKAKCRIRIIWVVYFLIIGQYRPVNH
jgi:hypothetical protein